METQRGSKAIRLCSVNRKDCNPPQFVGLLLAGGKSSRMAADKALLPYRGHLLIDHMMGIIESCSPRYVVVSGDRKVGKSVPDRWQGLGPIGGIASAIGELNETPELVVVVPIDMPLLTKEVLDTLLCAASANPHINALHYTAYELPILLRVNGELLKVLMEMVHPNTPPQHRSLRQLLQSLSALAISPPLDSSDAFFNVNSREDWKKLKGGEC